MKHFESNEMLICFIRQKYIQVYEICTHYQLLESNVCLYICRVWHLFENDKISKIPIILRNRYRICSQIGNLTLKIYLLNEFSMRKHFFYSTLKIVWNQHTKAAAFVYNIFNYFIAHRIAERFNCVDVFCFNAYKNSWICTNIQAEIFYSNLDEYFWHEQVELFRKWSFFLHFPSHLLSFYYYYFKFDVKVTQFWKHLSVRHEIIISMQPWFTYTNTFCSAIPILIHTRCNLMVK